MKLGIIILLAALLHLEADFVQVKEMQLMEGKQVSSGHLSYHAPDYMRWEYQSPENLVWEIDGEQTNTNPQVKRLLQMIMATIAGESLNDNANFEVQQEGNRYTLTPKKRELKQMFQQIILTLQPETQIAEQVVLIEKNGDTSTIRFHAIQTEYMSK
ncbi:MAG: outer membrane lipoprotein carrier protein LolA [Paludibacteraceae bacterium]